MVRIRAVAQALMQAFVDLDPARPQFAAWAGALACSSPVTATVPLRSVLGRKKAFLTRIRIGIGVFRGNIATRWSARNSPFLVGGEDRAGNFAPQNGGPRRKNQSGPPQRGGGPHVLRADQILVGRLSTRKRSGFARRRQTRALCRPKLGRSHCPLPRVIAPVEQDQPLLHHSHYARHWLRSRLDR